MVSSLPSSVNVNVPNVQVEGIDELRTSQEKNLQGVSGLLERNYTAVTISSIPYSKKSSTGLVQAFNAYSGSCILRQVQGFSKTPSGQNYLQIFDSTSPTGYPVACIMVDSGNNFFYSFDGGVVFDNGITIASSDNPFSNVGNNPDIYVTAFYKPYNP